MNFDLLKRTFQLLDPYSSKFSAVFYQNLLANPGLRVFLVKSRIELKEKEVMIALMIAIDHVKDRNSLKELASEKFNNREIYELFFQYRQLLGDIFLKTLESCLKEHWTKEVKQVWIEVYNLVTDLILEIKKEKFPTASYSLKSISSTVKELRLKAIAQKSLHDGYSTSLVGVNSSSKFT